jgi:hypothetical protein
MTRRNAPDAPHAPHAPCAGRVATALALTFTALLAGCGGALDDAATHRDSGAGVRETTFARWAPPMPMTTTAPPMPGVAVTDPAAAMAGERAVPPVVTPPLWDDEGHPLAPARDDGAREASEAQLEGERLRAGPTTVVLDLDTMESATAAVNLALGLRGSHPEPEAVSWFVRGGTPEDSTRLLTLLNRHGFTNVFVVG